LPDFPNPCRLRIATLVRVSTTHLAQADSPQHQRAHIQQEMDREGWVDSGHIYEAELTGAVIVDRPDIRRMLRDGQAGLFDAIVLKSISRLGRDTLGLLMVKRMLDDMRIELIALADGYRSFRDPELIFLVHAERAQAGRQEIAKNVRAGIVQAARRGIWPAGTLPLGLRKDSRLSIGRDPETAPLVELIYRLRGMHWGLPRICAHLNREMRVQAPAWWHVREQLRRLQILDGAPQDERVQERIRRLQARLLTQRFTWHPRTVRLLLQNTAYKGELQYNRTTTNRRMHGRLVREARDPALWVTVPCTPLVSPEQWDRAQVVALEHRRLPSRSRGSAFLLSGLITCGQCGASMRAQAARHNTGARGGDPKGYYLCRASTESGLHTAEYVRATELEQRIIQCLRAEMAGVRVPGPKSGGTQRGRDHVQQVGDLQAHLRDLAEARYFRREELRKGRLTEAEFAFEVAFIAAKAEEVQRRLSQLGAASAAGEPNDARLSNLRQAARAFAGLDAPDGVLKTLLPLLVSRVVVYPDARVKLHLRIQRAELDAHRA